MDKGVNTFIEMFAGIGGFRLGLESLGLRQPEHIARRGLPAVYGGPAATAPTLTASNMNHFGFVLEDGVYALGATEFEAIQGFPPGFTDIGGLTDRERMKLLGNAVTPQVARHAAASLLAER